MSPAESTTIQRPLIPDRLIAGVRARLAENKRVRRNLPIWGRIHIDRQLPFLCVYRRPVVGVDAGTARLVTGEASYVLASGVRRLHRGLAALVRDVGGVLFEEFGAFLIIELWAGAPSNDEEPASTGVSTPTFRVVAPRNQGLSAVLGTLARSLSGIRLAREAARVDVSRATRWCPKQFPPLLSASAARRLGFTVLGLELQPIYRDPISGESYPLVLRDLRRGMTRSLRRAFHEFTRAHTTRRPRHFHVLGRRAVVKAVWEADRRLAEVADAFDPLLQVSPVNARKAWRAFERNRFEKTPVFRYRPLPVDPFILKRRLYSAPIERIEDPALAQLFRETQDELDRRITLLVDVNTKRFLPGSMQLFGGVEDGLRSLAEELLGRLSPRVRDDSRRGYLDASAFARLARSEIEYYRQRWPDVNAGVQLRDDVPNGMMVSRGSLLIAGSARIPAARAHALLQHEIGTHVLTYYNGRAQPFRQLYTGLAGYDATQEGIAVLAEYLVGALSRPRLRLLAGRVAATHSMIEGASFVETFRMLHGGHGFGHQAAFNVTLRIYRSGGLTKDAVYLRGLQRLIRFLAEGGDLDALFVGKIAVNHLPIVRELQYRGVLRPVPLRPRYLDEPQSAGRLARLREGLTILQMAEEKTDADRVRCQ